MHAEDNFNEKTVWRQLFPYNRRRTTKSWNVNAFVDVFFFCVSKESKVKSRINSFLSFLSLVFPSIRIKILWQIEVHSSINHIQIYRKRKKYFLIEPLIILLTFSFSFLFVFFSAFLVKIWFEQRRSLFLSKYFETKFLIKMVTFCYCFDGGKFEKADSN